MERKSVQVYSTVKNILQDLKTSLKFKNESEVIAYLYAIYDGHYPNITLPEHETALKKMKELTSND